jgi:hypothetical protein
MFRRTDGVHNITGSRKKKDSVWEHHTNSSATHQSGCRRNKLKTHPDHRRAAWARPPSRDIANASTGCGLNRQVVSHSEARSGGGRRLWSHHSRFVSVLPPSAYTKPFHPSPTPCLAKAGAREHSTSSRTNSMSEKRAYVIGSSGDTWTPSLRSGGQEPGCPPLLFAHTELRCRSWIHPGTASHRLPWGHATMYVGAPRAASSRQSHEILCCVGRPKMVEFKHKTIAIWLNLGNSPCL